MTKTSKFNDHLSGVAIAAYLGQHLSRLSFRHSYRSLFIPGTIGSITWLARNDPLVPRIRHGLVLACLGDAGRFTYKKSRGGDAMPQAARWPDGGIPADSRVDAFGGR